MKNKSLILYKYLISYIIIFLIPYVTISAVFYFMSVHNLRTEIIKSNVEKIEQVIEFTDTRMKELRSLAIRISYDHRLTPYMFSQPYYSKLAIEELNSYKANSAIIDGLYLYYQGNDQLYSQRGSTTIHTLLNAVYRVKEDEGEKFNQKLQTVTKPITYPIELDTNSGDKSQKLISYLYPIPTNSSFSYGTVAFLVKESTLKKLTQNVLGDFNGNIYIFNEDNDLLSANNKGEKIDLKEIKPFASGQTGVINKTINGRNYSMVVVRSENTNWTIVTTMPTTQFYEKMSSLKFTILLILTIIALIGIVTAIFMSFRQYRPIQNLAHSLKSKHKNITNNNDKDELASIHETINLMYENSEELQKKIVSQQPFIRDQLLLLLLKGDLKDETEINKLLRDAGINFIGSKFFITLILFKDKVLEHKSLQNREIILSNLRNVSINSCKGYGVELIHENGLAIITNIDDTAERTEEVQRNFIEVLKEQLKKFSTEMPIITVGKVYEELSWINRSFIEANASVEYNLLNYEHNTVYFEDIAMEKTETALWLPQEEQAKLTHSMKQGDKVVALETLGTMFNNIKDQKMSPHILKCICFDMINCVLKTTLELGMKESSMEVQKLVDFTSVIDLENKLSHSIPIICEEVEKSKENTDNLLKLNIIKHIQEEYKSHSLGLEYTAEKFQLSASYLSRFMKEQTGKTFTQYVWRLRNDEFKRQLRETDYPIKKIVEDIGYVDVANFTRKFKKEEGITPGQYRKQYKVK
ncbi:AraC family transcriptional regulator [Virgibacillus halodenitrificans]|uniref:AraC family transcriptional regulator n=1 Tax=Virgibacillus halodenitrificans TaxID=1482 RepID=UPI000761B11C